MRKGFTLERDLLPYGDRIFHSSSIYSMSLTSETGLYLRERPNAVGRQELPLVQYMFNESDL